MHVDDWRQSGANVTSLTDEQYRRLRQVILDELNRQRRRRRRRRRTTSAAETTAATIAETADATTEIPTTAAVEVEVSVT